MRRVFEFLLAGLAAYLIVACFLALLGLILRAGWVAFKFGWNLV